MQTDLNARAPDAIAILGVNAAGLASANGEITAGRSLPWLQDTTTANVWGAWKVTWRDVVVLDAQNHRAYVYNLTYHDLTDTKNYAALETILLNAR